MTLPTSISGKRFSEVMFQNAMRIGIIRIYKALQIKKFRASTPFYNMNIPAPSICKESKGFKKTTNTELGFALLNAPYYLIITRYIKY